MKLWSTALAVIAASSFLAKADVALQPGTPVFDRPTLTALGIQLPITGDDNYNSSVTVRYKKHKDTTWSTGLPLFHVHPDTTLPYVISPQFAGSIVDLRPATSYDVELHIVDPDPPAVDQLIYMTGVTRSVPGDPVTPRNVSVNSVRTLNNALSAAKPGDIITLANGTYAGQFILYASGTSDNPVVIRGASQDGVILDGRKCSTCNVLEAYGSWVHVENMTIQNAQRALRFQGSGAQGNVVRRVHTKNTTLGFGSNTNQLDFYIADNILEGRLTWPLVYSDDNGKHASDDGIHVQGSGHVVAHNRISGFGDAMKTAQDGARAVEFYGNDILWTYDNGVELDGSEGNARCMRNRFTNTYMTISGQPIYGGPAYIYRNVSMNADQEQLKLHSEANPTREPNGVFAYNNTFVSANYALALETPTSVHHFALENNIFIGPTTPVQTVDWYAIIDDGLFDYNGYYPDGMKFAYRYPDTYIQVTNFADLQRARPALEPHGMVVNASTLANGMVGPATYKNLIAPQDFTLSTNSVAIDRGVVIPNITDGFAGVAPDLGAIESGCSIAPVYGPRPVGTDETNLPYGCTGR